MLKALKNEMNRTYTENGAVTHISTRSDCLDLFATIGAIRQADEQEIENRFARAFFENPDIAMKILFFGRDVRGGLGERRVFRVALRWLAENKPVTLRKNISLVAEYGRFDDLLALMGTPCEKDALAILKDQFLKDREAMKQGTPISLLAKWLPSVNASNAVTVANGKRMAKALGLTQCEYRKELSAMRKHLKIIENNLREKDYSFDYAKQPSRAMLKYRAAFFRNDGERYQTFLKNVSEGKSQLHTGTLTPYDVITPFLTNGWQNRHFMRNISESEKLALNTTWESLPDYGTGENAIAVVDTSGSMYNNYKAMPAAVALSLGLYLAEHNKGLFHNHFIEFSSDPQLIELKGETFADRLYYASGFNVIADTNIEAVFDVILRAAVNHHVPQEELPAAIYIISDMEFNFCVRDADKSNFESAKQRFEAAGYKLPKVVFWNVAARNRQQPVTQNEQGVALVSGCSPRLFAQVLSGEMTPYQYMMEVIGSERYRAVAA